MMVLLAGFTLHATEGTKSNPYAIIVARNPFGLRPIPIVEPPPPPAAPPAPRPEIKITGITTLLGAPKALFQYEDKETKRTEFPPLLAEGDTYKMLSVIQIDPENERVRIRNGDTEMLLDFIANGVRPTSTTVAAAASSLNIPPTVVSNPGGRSIVAGPAPTQTLPPALLERMRQLQERGQAEQASHSRILPAPGGALNHAPASP